MTAETDERGVFELLRDGRDIARNILENWVSGDLAVAVNALEGWAAEANALLNTSAAEYAQAVCDAPDGGYSQAYADQMRTALLTIAAFKGADTDLDATAACMRRYAQDALMPPGALKAPEVGETYVVDANNAPPGFKGELNEVTLDELTLGPLANSPRLADGLPAVPESGDIPLPNGCRLYWKTEQSINCREYFTDEVGGGAHVWSPAIISPSTLLAAIVLEEQLGNLEVIHARRRNEGTMRKSAETFSIFGQIEAAAAEVLIASGEITRIEPERIPVSARFNERNEPALFAVIVPADKVERFEKIIADLRA